MKYDEKNEHPEEVVFLKEEFIKLTPFYHHHEGTNDYSNSRIDIHEVVDKAGQIVEPVLAETWTEVSPGIETCKMNENLHVKIYKYACPVRILFREFYEYISYDNYEHCCQHARFYWVLYKC